MSRGLSGIGFWMVTLALLGVAAGASAQTRTEVLRWEDPINSSSDVVGYRVYHGFVSGSYTQSADVADPAMVNDAYEYSVVVDADADVYFAVTAYNSDNESVFSNEICRGPTGPCQTSDPNATTDPTSDPTAEEIGVPGQPHLIMP